MNTLLRTFSSVLLSAVLLPLFLTPQCLAADDPNQIAREFMAEVYVAQEGVQNARVIESIRSVPRHVFVPSNVRKYAYEDMALAIGFKQTISPPFVVAYMTEQLDPQPTDKVLEIGTGSGYQAAVLSSLVKDVYTIEIVEPLGKRAARTLKGLEYENVHTKIGDGYLGWPEAAPFNKIIVTCSPESVPKPLVEQLAEGGTMIIPLGERYQQTFFKYVKKNGQLQRTQLIPTLFVPMTGQSEENRNVLPNPSRPKLINGDFEVDKNADGLADGWHYQRRSTLKKYEQAEGTFIEFDNDIPGRMAHMLQGFAVDGKQIAQLRFEVSYQGQNFRSGRERGENPGGRIYFYDRLRKTVHAEVMGPWRESTEWETQTYTVNVPAEAKEAIVQFGLNGATGTVAIDQISMKIRLR